MTETWIILGASSAIARAFARQQAATGARLILAGRNHQELLEQAQDLCLRGAPEADAAEFDIRNPGTFAPIIDLAAQTTGTVNAAVFVGSMPEQADIDRDPDLLDTVVLDNFTGPAHFLHALAPLLEARGKGTVIGIGSVAGDRGRLGNYAYGAAKAGFHTYLSGLRNRLGRKGVQVITVKPGFVDTAMTWGIEGMFLVASPEDIAKALITATRKRKNEIYTPWFWRYIMLIIRNIPEFIFKKLSI